MTMNLSPGIPTPEFPNFDNVNAYRSRFLERAPNAQDWNQLISEILAHQEVLKTGDYTTAVNAVGDGVTDDTEALQAAIATGKNVELDPTKTYLIRDTLALGTGQIFEGRGATIKIMNQAVTSTADSIVSGVTQQLTVASVTGFAVNDYIGVQKSTLLYSVQTRKIIRIDPVANVLYLEVPINTGGDTTITGTTFVYRAFYAMRSSSTGYCTIRNVNIDGNTANQTYGYWTQTGGMSIAGDFNTVDNCRLYNILGEGIVAFGNENHIRCSRFTDLAGNGVHFSGGNHTSVDSCYFKNCGKNLMIQHNHGGISWSALCAKVAVSNCWFEDNLKGCDGISGNDESDVKIINNFFLQNDNGSIGVNATIGGTGSHRCLISGNWSYEDSATNLAMVGNNFTTEIVQNMIVTNNHFIHDFTASAAAIQKLRGVTFSNNVCHVLNASHAGATVRFDGCIGVVAANNIIRAGSIGILCETTSTFIVKSCTIIGNMVSENKTVGIRCNSTDALDVNISNNTVWNDPATTSNGYIGIIGNSGTVIQSNVIRIDSNGGVITTTKGITIASSPVTGIGCIVQLNQVRGNPQYGIQITGGTGKVVVQYNICTTSAVLINSGGTVTTPASSLAYTGIVSGGALELGTGKVSVGGGGAGYSGTVTVFFRQGTNATAFGTATLSGDAVSGVNIQTAGTGYVTPGTVIEVLVGGNYVQGNFTLPTTG